MKFRNLKLDNKIFNRPKYYLVASCPELMHDNLNYWINQNLDGIWWMYEFSLINNVLLQKNNEKNNNEINSFIKNHYQNQQIII